ncbi:sensor histidine kinase [Mariprofundus sp. EBB-1]|uniref:sensor histidine kinase n=1 Tax=Mariprofundus sp. EBB-1 TaxID=2650971 RepID=UPI001F2F6F89|nr:HAMP domain-containing sensor histidine kinase [Mariprofundus sp. EBB-1]
MKKHDVSPKSGEQVDDSEQEVHAQKMVSLGHFTQAIVHDIRNALHVVGSASTLIERRTDDAAIHHHVNTIHKTIGRTNDLIERILSFANNSEEHLGIIDLPHSIDESIQHARPMFPAGISMEWQRPLQEMHILGDDGQIYQVILNLLKNAIEAIGRDNEGSITMNLRKVYPWAEIRVKDSGPGIDVAVIGRLLDSGFTTKPDGNGFGLANVAAIVKKHSGTIQIVSNPGEGAEFILLLPLLPELNE